MARILNHFLEFFFHYKFKKKLTRILIDMSFSFYKSLISERILLQEFLDLNFGKKKTNRNNIMIVTFYSLMSLHVY